MKEFYLENEKLKVKICGKGAELRSIYGKEKGLEYLWNADPKYWARSSPLLFPFIGRLNGKKYRHNGVEYDMEPHGLSSPHFRSELFNVSSAQNLSSARGTSFSAL